MSKIKMTESHSVKSDRRYAILAYDNRTIIVAIIEIKIDELRRARAPHATTYARMHDSELFDYSEFRGRDRRVWLSRK